MFNIAGAHRRITRAFGLATRAELEEMEERMNLRITAFQDRFNTAFAKANLDLTNLEGRVSTDETKLATDESKITLDEGTIAQLKTEEAGLQQEIADLKAKQDAGTFGDDDAAALADIETKYQALLTRLGADANPPAPAPEPAAPASGS